MTVDLLVFGPHPDDIEIGAGGTSRATRRSGCRVGLCDLTAGEMGSNGTVEERLTEAEAARQVLGAAWRENLRWPDRRIGKDPAHLDAGRRLHPPASAAGRSPRRTGSIGIPITSPPAPFSPRRSSTAACGAIAAEGEPWKAEWVCYYFINDSAAPSFVVDVSDYYERKRQALDCHASQFRAGPDAVGTRLNTPLFRQLIESRDAQFGALAGVTWAEGIVVREPVVRPTLDEVAITAN